MTITNFKIGFGFDCTSLSGQAQVYERMELFHTCFVEDVGNKLGQPIPAEFGNLPVGANGYPLAVDPLTGSVSDAAVVQLVRDRLAATAVSPDYAMTVADTPYFCSCLFNPNSLRWEPCIGLNVLVNGEPYLGIDAAKMFEARHKSPIAEADHVQLRALRVRAFISWEVPMSS